MPKKMTTNDWIMRARNVHGDFYNYDKVVYVRSTDKVIIQCPIHGDLHIEANSHLQGNGKCRRCAYESKLSDDMISDRWAVYLGKFKNTHGDKYDYSNSVYTKAHDPIDIVCPIHGVFTQKPVKHANGQGCPRCNGGRLFTTAEFINNAVSVHGNQYNYTSVNYVNAHTPVDIICPDHGIFNQLPLSHINHQSGCPTCNGGISYTHEEFEKLANTRHNNAYNYPDKYHGSHNKITIVCPIHGDFMQQPDSHLGGCGCPRCNNIFSDGEREVGEFIEQYAQMERSDRKIIKPKELDIVVPSKKVAIEYCGLYWHSSYSGGKDKKYHKNKHEAADAAGYRLVTIFEDEWLTKRNIVEDTLRHFMGASPKGVGARKTTIREISWATAKGFLNRHHLMGAGKAGNYRIGAYHGDELISVMVFGYPSDERGKKDVIEMKRFVTNGNNNPGVGSKMFKHAIREKHYCSVIAFVDRRWFTGSFKSIAGFRVIHTTPPAKYWIKGKNRYHRRFMSKLQLVGLGGDPTKTKEQLMRDAGYDVIYDCGKVKLGWDSE